MRARWKLPNAPVFLMSAWFKAEPFAQNATVQSAETKTLKLGSPKASSYASSKIVAAQASPHADAAPVLLLADPGWSSVLREGAASGSLGDTLDFQSILNEFDADHDGWAELLIHSDQGTATTITLYLYSDKGFAPLKTPLRREAQSPESCVDP